MREPKKLESWQVEDASRLDALFGQRSSLSQAAFGAQFEIGTQGMVWQYLKGKRPLNISAARKFAEGLEVAIGEFSPTLAQQIAQASALTVNAARSSEDEFVTVPRIDVRLSAGAGQVAYSEDVTSRLSFRADFLRSAGSGPEHSVSTQVDGRSMEPTLPDGSIVLLNLKAKSIVDGRIYAYRYDGELKLKRLHKLKDGRIAAKSDNPEFEDAILDGASDDFEIIGRAFWMGVKL